MYYSSLFVLLLGPLVAQGQSSCNPSVRTVVETVTVTGSPIKPPTFDTSVTFSSVAPPTPSSIAVSSGDEDEPATQGTQSTPSPIKSTGTSTAAYADATETDVGVPATEQCGPDNRLTMPGMAWTVANSMYNSGQMDGTQCTNFNDVLEASDGTLLVNWTSTTEIKKRDDTEDLCKGYSNVGIGVNLKERLSDIKSIPAHFSWSRTVTGDFKGAHIFDFVTSSVEGAAAKTGSNEFMLFLRIWGGQVPIGYADGPVASFDMYGTTWQMYQGPNEEDGQTVYSLIPDTPFESEFTGDLKTWLDTMATEGYASADEYVNIGNGGVEVFYGSSQMDATVALDIVV